MFRWLLRFTHASRRFQPTPSLIPLVSALAIVLAATTGAMLLNGSPASAGSGDARPRVTNVTSPLADGVYGAGARIPITVHFDQAVAVDVPDSSVGPRLRLETGRSDARARFLRLSSYSNILTFLYSVRLGDRSPDLDVAVERILLNGARIHNRAGIDADVTLPRPGRPGSLSANKDLVIRTLRGLTDAVGAPPPATNVAPPVNNVAERADTPPRVINVSSPLPDGRYGVGARIPITVQFDQSVVIEFPILGVPSLRLETGRSDATAPYSGAVISTSPHSPRILTFLYVVRPGDHSPKLDVAIERILLNGATIHNRTGVEADVTLPRPGRPGSLSANKNLVISSVSGPTHDGGTPPPTTNVAPALNDVADRTDVPPRVLYISSPRPNGTYGIGARILITVHFDQPVAVDVSDAGRSPSLSLETGRSDATARYSPRASSTTVLAFLYIVRPGDRSPDLDVAITRILLNGATIHNRTGVPADVTLPTPGAHGSLSASKDLVIVGAAQGPGNP